MFSWTTDTGQTGPLPCRLSYYTMQEGQQEIYCEIEWKKRSPPCYEEVMQYYSILPAKYSANICGEGCAEIGQSDSTSYAEN